MSEHTTNDNESVISNSERIFASIAKHEPKPVSSFVPGNVEDERRKFFAGEVRNPSYVYPKLEALDPLESMAALELEVCNMKDAMGEHSPDYVAYSEYANRYISVHELLYAAQHVHSPDADTAESAQTRFMELNEQLYGAPDELTYRSLLREVVDIPTTAETDRVKAELIALLPEIGTQANERFKPSDETVRHMGEIAEYMYGGMLAHIPPEQEEFSPNEIADVFRSIIKDEFGDAARDWSVQVVKASSISVAASEKIVKVPEDRRPVSNATLRGLVAHELGVHMLRSIQGSETNLPLLATGLSDYYDSEEGLGVVMEQAVKGEYAESGVTHYLIAGLMHFDQKDYRDTYDIMYRLKYLEAVNDGEPADESTLAASQSAAEKSVMRLARGTNILPWFKDLAYYNGATKMWKHFEETSGDFESFMLTFIGKADPSIPGHKRVILETKSL